MGFIESSKDAIKSDTEESYSDSESHASSDSEESSNEATMERSIWVGNLFFKMTPDEVKEFFSDCGRILKLDMPFIDNSNKGFARVFFSRVSSVVKAISLSETEIFKRKLLIKCGVDYSKKPKPQATLFVGNLSFNTTKSQIQSLFIKFGKIISVRMATFEDSGKCKGFAYVDFEKVESGKNAMQKTYKLNGRKLNVEYATLEATKKGRPWESSENADHAEVASKKRRIK